MRWIDAFNRWPQAPLIFAILCINHFIPLPDANEEMYFGLALQYVEPGWVPDSFSFSESPGTRLLFQWPIGMALKVLSFEWVAIIGRIICYAIFSMLLAGIFSSFQLTNLSVFFLLQVIFNRNQAFFAGEWIFQDFETKTIAYIFILLSLKSVIREKWRASVLWTVPAVYFHVLVGGWYFIALFIFLNLKRLPLKTVIGYGSIFTILVLPYLFYLSSQVLIDQRDVINGVNLDWVYTYYRNPHHTVSFYKGWSFFRIHRFDGFLMLLAAIILGVIFYRRTTNPTVKNLWIFAFATYILLLLAIGISAVDTTGKLLKFYVFRIGTVSFLVTCILLLFELQNAISKSRFKSALRFAMLAGCLISIPHVLHRKISRLPPEDPAYQSMTSYLRENMEPGTTILGSLDDVGFDFIRKTRCDLFITQKYVPSGGEKLHEWYQRFEEQQALEKNWDLLPSFLSKRTGVEYILTSENLHRFDQKLDLTIQEGSYYLYKVKEARMEDQTPSNPI
tara:strand:- start:8621 stop:10135 length:1515 start_codon:yes stop_codon:yes gene_type:complete